MKGNNILRCDTSECRVVTFIPTHHNCCPSCKLSGIPLREGVNHIQDFVDARNRYRQEKDAEQRVG